MSPLKVSSHLRRVSLMLLEIGSCHAHGLRDNEDVTEYDGWDGRCRKELDKCCQMVRISESSKMERVESREIHTYACGS